MHMQLHVFRSVGVCNYTDRLWEQSYQEKTVLLLTDSVTIPSIFKNKFSIIPVIQNIEIYTILFYKVNIASEINLNIFEIPFLNK